jgi:hypothetical protein
MADLVIKVLLGDPEILEAVRFAGGVLFQVRSGLAAGGSRIRTAGPTVTLNATGALPSPLGRSTRRTGGGKELPEDIRFQSL